MIDKKVAIVTGGTRGMGQAISTALAERGNIVLAVYRSHADSAKETLEKIRSYEPQSGIIKADVSRQEDICGVINYVEREYGRVDILVNNAGIFDFNFIQDMTEEYLDRILSVNFKSQFLMTKAVIPYMKKACFGRIVNASSISSTFADCGLLAYGASKACVDMLTKISAAELGPYGITVNAYAPGIMRTDMTDAMIRERGEEQVRQISMGRFGKSREAAALVAFLASEASSYVTGEIIGVDGGMLKVQNPYRAYEYSKNEG